MSYQLSRLGANHPLLGDSQAAIAAFREAIEDLLDVRSVSYRRLWAYYRNPMRITPLPAGSEVAGSERPYRQAQEWGLPPRLTGYLSGEEPFAETLVETSRKEVVVENDIGWRIDTSVDFLFGRSIVLDSAAPDEARARLIGELLRQIIANHGGLAFLQRMALIGAVYGSVDVLVKLDTECLEGMDTRPLKQAGLDEKTSGTKELDASGEGATVEHNDVVEHDEQNVAPCNTSTLGGQSIETTGSGASVDLVMPEAEPSPNAPSMPIAQLAGLIILELVEPGRALPLLAPDDVNDVSAFAQVYQVARGAEGEREGAQALLAGARTGDEGRTSWLRRLLFPTRVAFNRDEPVTVVEIISSTAWQVYRDERLVEEGDNPLGVLPLVHAQNIARPFEYEGGGDVEPLIPLQDELNTRLSDRATRVALQSMKMYLGVGIEGFGEEPVQPGRMWATDNLEARVTEFGGDAHSPSEASAIQEIREALDKSSGVNPVASGAIRNRVGNLTSAAALRLTFQSLLARTERKRSNYGSAIERMCELALAWLEVAGVFATRPEERRVRITWPDPIPSSMTEQLEQARLKQSIGIDEQRVQRELGY